ncbi:murein L,D-transpeptidase catalytic domain family protein [Sphingomonas sp. 10B4]|uniref:murein L,D-transpeptidase catalytic domain family protein n=1 Tax=Sphingomonas sp. 10B4 TaxID=3048575 RepID=UPI002AB529CF|nr:murein L,D-transpeptidase catalytic domain family protein [Sphingomonas sp. 10B4]MDY7523927.1 murein L,D-transpeptidase catalytic domain family protein [Sphingomonas sp. 10B4]MEB0282557.1 murein L,D-transpeptidase catalytic domain family protein [Sphingomonas sp. 10B4]
MSQIVQHSVPTLSRRNLGKAGLALLGAAALPRIATAAQVPATVQPLASTRVVRPELLRRAMSAFHRHGAQIARRDRIAIADFSQPSSQPRFYLIDMASGMTTTLLVAHGSGSDPAHTGFLQRFSNAEGSNASSEGAFVASDYYVGKHGLSQRLIGLDPTNSNALSRALVVHAAWYANPDMLRTHGQLGRSQGCFAVSEGDLQQVFARLGEGRMIYSAKV